MKLMSQIEAENKSKYFINALNIGFLASSVEVSEKMPKIIRRFRYPISFWIKISFKKQKISINLKPEFNNNTFNIKW